MEASPRARPSDACSPTTGELPVILPQHAIRSKKTTPGPGGYASIWATRLPAPGHGTISAISGIQTLC